MATFTWTPSFGSSRAAAPRTIKAQFGDGYDQRVGDGINTNLRTWSLQFNNCAAADADAIDAFLAARGATEAFDWTDPDGNPGLWVCEQWAVATVESAPATRVKNVTATFREVMG